MAIRTKTIEYPFDTRLTNLATNTAIGTATRYDTTAINVDIPESTSRVFRSVLVVFTFRDVYATAYNFTAWRIGIKIGAVAANDVDTTVTLTNTGDHCSFCMTRDATSYFTTNYTGTTQSVIASLAVATATATNINNITAKLVITYDYDDSAQDTRIKTVRIPIESKVTQLTNSSLEIGTNQVPALDTFLPESTKVYKQIWFEFKCNDGGNATTNFNLFVALDAEAAATRATLTQALNSGVWFEDIWVRNDMTTSATHALKAYSSLTSRFTNFGAVLCVTYTYSHTSSTRIINSLVMGIGSDSNLNFGSTATGDKSALYQPFQIAEPGTITLVQSGVFLFWSGSATMTLSVGCGAQAVRAYTCTAGSVTAGNYSLFHRIDAGGAQGAGITLQRGACSLTTNYFSGTASLGGSMSGILYLNYTSDKHTSGDGAHAHSCLLIGSIGTANAVETIVASLAPTIPEADYWLNDISAWLLATGAVTAGSSLELAVEAGAGEGAGAGWIPTMLVFPRAAAELSTYHFFQQLRGMNRFIGDPEMITYGPVMMFETTRSYRLWSQLSLHASFHLWYTYSSLLYTVSGNLSGYTGDGSGITVTLHNATTGEKLKTATTGAGGTFSFSWYDNATQLYVEAQQDSTHVGRSANLTAG